MLITDHALHSYRDRVAKRRISLATAAAEIADALEAPLFCASNSKGPFLGLRNSHGVVFGASVSSDMSTVVGIGPAWYWHEFRHLWREHGWDIKRNRPRASVVADGIAPTRALDLDERLRDHRERYRGLSAKARPLLVTARLRCQAPVATYDPVALDAVLAYAVVLEATGFAMFDRDQGPMQIPLPAWALWRDPTNGAPLWACSCFAPVGVSLESVVYRHKRAPRGLWSRSATCPMLIDTASGRYMERRIPVPVRTADVWAATMIGDPDEVTRLLHFVRSIGKGRSIGLGEVAEWHVADYDEFSLHRDGRLIRSLPADAAHAMGISMTGDPEPLIGWTPPYWHPVLRRPGYRTGHPVAPGG